MTEDENGKVRVTEEVILNEMWADDFFIKLLVFKERSDKRVEQLNKLRKHGKNNA